jgi:hypothetical protein
MEKIKVDEVTFNNVLAMLNSSDKENKVVALSCIEELDVKSGIVYLLLFKKLANVPSALWKEHAPKKLDYLKQLGFNAEQVITYKKILDLICEKQVPFTDIQFFLDKFTLSIIEMIPEEYGKIEKIDINVKFKKNESKPSKQSSKDLQELDA